MAKLKAAMLAPIACGIAIGAAAVPIADDSVERAQIVGSQLASTTTAILAADGSGMAVATDAKSGLANSRDEDLQLEQPSSSDTANLPLNDLDTFDAPL